MRMYFVFWNSDYTKKRNIDVFALTRKINAPQSYCTGYKFVSTPTFDP